MFYLFDEIAEEYFQDSPNLKNNILSKKEQYIEYFNYIIKWNRRINVTGFDKKEFIFSGLLEPLLILKNFTAFKSPITDIGTGAGIPSVSFAIYFEKFKIYGIEVNKKKLSLLNSLKFKLNLNNFYIEDTLPLNSLFIVSRAFMNLEKFLLFLKKERISFKYMIFYFKDKLEISQELKLMDYIEYQNPFKKNHKYLQGVFLNKKFNCTI